MIDIKDQETFLEKIAELKNAGATEQEQANYFEMSVTSFRATRAYVKESVHQRELMKA